MLVFVEEIPRVLASHFTNMEVLPRQARVLLQTMGQLWGMGAPCMATHDIAQDVAPRGLLC